MSKSGEKDELVPLPPNAISKYLSRDLENSQMDEENGSTDMVELKESTNITTNLTNNFSTSKEEANKSIYVSDDSSCRDLSKRPTNTSMPNEVSGPSSSHSSFVYKPFDYTLNGLTDFESTICSVREDYSELTGCTSYLRNQNENFKIVTSNSKFFVTADSLLNEESIRSPENSQLKNRVTTLGEEGDLNNIFCSTMRNPEEMISAFPADESGLSNQDNEETAGSPEVNNGQKIMQNPKDNPEEFKQIADKRKCNDTLLEYLLEVTEFSENIPSQSQRSVFQHKANATHLKDIKISGNLGNNLEEIGETVEKEKDNSLESGELSENTTLEMQQDQFRSVAEALEVKAATDGKENLIFQPKIIQSPTNNAEDIRKTVGDGTINDTFESGELPEDTTSDVHQEQPTHRTSDVEDGEVSDEENDAPNGLPTEMLAGQAIGRDTLAENEVSKLIKSGPDRFGSADMEDGEVFGEDNDNVPIEEPKEENSVMPICRFHIRNACRWGSNCRFRHPKMGNKGNYEMFEKKVLPGPPPTPPGWTPFTAPCVDTFQTSQAEKITWRLGSATKTRFNVLDNDPYYSQNGQERVPLLPTPTFDELLMAQKKYQNQTVRQPPIPPKHKPIMWEKRLSSSSPSPSPNVSPSRLSKHIRSNSRPTSTSSAMSRQAIKRARCPSPPRTFVNKSRGPRTPSCSPPRRVNIMVRPEPKQKCLSNNDDNSSESSESTSYESTTESSDDFSSSSESDAREASSKRAWKTSTSSSGSQEKYTSKNEKASSSKYAEKRRTKTSKSKTRKQSHTQTPSKSSTKTPARNPLKVMPNAPKKPRSAMDTSYSTKKKMSRQKYLLMQLLHVEEQIAKKKKRRLKTAKV
ncbi:zinc finger CCCH domain-containing protein 18 isoform X1 [Drosophila suzukii]|uniref:Zinc finger CCCH domain-containing protein 18 isoform X1 n=1 Tax=Drosophila suzukii TaxID=28584 RepID=A0AB40DML8_DROSZ